MNIQEIAALADKVKDNISRVIIGKEHLIDLVLSALLAKGHVLLEDVPGTGKTMLARSLASSFGCDFARIQFTPDLLPSDVIGMRIFQPQTGEFVFMKGPAFTQILLADEINRATPRTQSALLECMEERQITEGGVTRQLQEPFLVIATQNPVEIQGTFPLPEAQLDRFLVCLKMGYPKADESLKILKCHLGGQMNKSLSCAASREELLDAQQSVSQVEVSEDVLQYIADICERTRTMENVLLGASPRGMLALMRASRALAAIRGRDFTTPADVKEMAVPVLAHRLILRSQFGKNNQPEMIIEQVLSAVTVPTEAKNS